MRKSLIIPIVFFLALVLYSDFAYASVNIGTYSGVPINRNRAVCKTSNGIIHAIWANGATGIKYSNSTDGITWTTPLLVNNVNSYPSIDCNGLNVTILASTYLYNNTNSGVGGFPTNYSLGIGDLGLGGQVQRIGSRIYAIGSSGKINVSFTSNADNAIPTWTNTTFVSSANNGHNSIWVNGTGTSNDIIYATYTVGSNIYLNKSTNGGTSFGIGVVVISASGILDPNIIGNSTQVMVSADDNSYNVYYANSTDGGSTFTQQTICTAPNTAYWTYCEQNSISIDNNGNPYVSFALENTTAIQSYKNLTASGSWSGYFNVSTFGTVTDYMSASPLASNKTIDFLDIDGTNIRYNFGYAPSPISLSNNNLYLTASPAWGIISGATSTVGCTADNGNPTLQRNGTVTSNPDIQTLTVADYNYTCFIASSVSYLANTTSNTLSVAVNPSGCLNPTIYSYTINVSTANNYLGVNFTQLNGTSPLLKPDFSDIQVLNSTTLTSVQSWINKTSIIVNTTADKGLTLNFGNVYTNSPFTVTQIVPNSTQNISTYNQTSYTRYVYTMKDEPTFTQIVPTGANLTLQVFCPTSTILIPFTGTMATLPVTVTPNLVRTIVNQTAGVYYRSLIPNSYSESRNFYLVDLTNQTLVATRINLNDLTGTFLTATLKLQKYMNGTLDSINEDRFDSEGKVIAYLLKDNYYQVTATNSVETRNIGNLQADVFVTTKQLTIGSSQIQANQTLFGSIFYNFTQTTTNLGFLYNDTNLRTNWVAFWVYNGSNPSQLLYFSNQSTNANSTTFVYSPANLNQSYIVQFKASHQIYGSGTVQGATTLIFGNFLQAVAFIAAFPSTWVTIIGAGMILSFSMLFGFVHSKIGSLVVVGIAVLVSTWNFNTINIAIVGVAGFLAIANILIGRRQVA